MEQKIEQQELDTLHNITKKYEELVIAFGQLQVQRILLKQQLEKLDENEQKLKQEYSDNQILERNTVTNLNKKYGEGQLNLEDGTFISMKSSTK